MLYRYPKSKKYPYEIPTKTGFLRLAIQKIHCYNIPINNRNLARKRFPKKLSGGI